MLSGKSWPNKSCRQAMWYVKPAGLSLFNVCSCAVIASDSLKAWLCGVFVKPQL